MGITVRAVDLEAEEHELLAVLQRNLSDLPHARRFSWLYRNNPLGPARSWLARDSISGQAVGVASVFRRAVWIGPRLRLGGQVGDFAIDPSYRTLGPALMLQRATFEPVDSGELAFCYDCPPDDRGMSTFRRLGMTSDATMARYARLLRADRQVTRWLGHGLLAAGARPLANVLTRLGPRRPRARALDIAVHRGRFDEEFSVLDEGVGGDDVIRGRRAAEDLNWRYRDDPLHEYEVLTARRRGELHGFIVLTVDEEDAFVVDLFGRLESEEAAALLEAGARHLAETSVQTLHAHISVGSRQEMALRRSRFRVRNLGPSIVAYMRRNDEDRALLEGALAWGFTRSDVMA